MNRLSYHKNALRGMSFLLAVVVFPLMAAAQEVDLQGKTGEVRKGTINLIVNQDTTIRMKVTDIAIGNSAIAKVGQVEDGSAVLLSARAAGTTELRLWPMEKPGTIYVYTINVSDRDIDELKVEVEELLGSMLGVAVKKAGNKLVLDGSVYKRSDRQRLDTIINEYRLLDLTHDIFDKIEETKRLQAEELEEQRIIEAMKADLASHRLLQVEAEMRTVRGERRLFLTGRIFSDKFKDDEIGEERMDRVMAIASIYYDEGKIVNLVESMNPVIEIELQLASVDEVKARQVGDNNLWNSLMHVDIGDGMTYSSADNPNFTKPTFNIGRGANTSLHALHTNGVTRAYIQQAQAVKSGLTASFTEGGELYFTVQGETPIMEKVEFGFLADVTPVLYEDGMVKMHIQVTNSVPVQQQAGVTDEAALTLDKYETESTIEVQRGDSVVLSGIDSATAGESVAETPILSKIPIINFFFKAKSGTRQSLRTLLVLTPTVDVKYFTRGVAETVTSRAAEDIMATREETATRRQRLGVGSEAAASMEERFESQKEKEKKWYNPATWH